MLQPFVASAQIKLVIWDLDDTFWRGTLSEGSVELIKEHVGIVKVLADRGIMSSICSKNDFEPVQNVLQEAGIWDFFIFPHIAFVAKGQAVQSIVEKTNLRPQNVLFVDDNLINIEEVRFNCPEMMVALPEAVLPGLLDLPEAQGKSDHGHSRLKQYKSLEKKVQDRKVTALSNSEFLRQCDIKISFDYKVENYFDRIVELINRSNQLNYTKKRLNNIHDINNFKKILDGYNVFASAIFAKDRYGDHGLVGFYLQNKTERINELIHYVWSCRMMNVGLEQFVWEHLGRPVVKVVEPVSNPIACFERVDWITLIQRDTEAEVATGSKLLLLGSCDLTAVATYCSPNRVEYVNGVYNGVMTRFDDFAFILSDPDVVGNSKILPTVPAWQHADIVRLQSDLADSEILVISLSAAMKGAYMLTDDGVAIRIHPEGLGLHIDVNPSALYLKHSRIFTLAHSQHLALLGHALTEITRRAKSAKRVFLLGANTRDVSQTLGKAELELLANYNAACVTFAANLPNWHFVSIDEVVSEDKLIDDRHYTRLGYHEIATHILARMSIMPNQAQSVEGPATPPFDITELVKTGKLQGRFELLGSDDGYKGHIKRIIKMSPLSTLARKIVLRLRNVA